MAVQAQYPSHVLLQNRSVQEGRQEGEGGESSRFLDLQSPNHILFDSFQVGGDANPRKRRREADMNQLVSPYDRGQSHSSHLIDLTKLHSRNVAVSTGLRLAFNDQKHSVSPQSNKVFSEEFSSQINQERDEIHQFLQVQGEVLRRTLAVKRERHYYALIGAAEEVAARKMREKGLEAEKAVRRHAELEARAAQLSAEAQVWQARAREQEAEAAALQAELQLAIVNVGSGGSRCASQAEEGCAAAGETGDAESAYLDPERVAAASGPGCKACGSRVASVVLLPCRHLCVCTRCDDVVRSCPLCLSFRSSSIEVYMS